MPNSAGTRGPPASETSREVARTTAPFRCGRWQVFGLVGSQRPPKTLDLPAAASQAHRPVLMTAFVPTYRCGAAPESHRIPCCLPRPLTDRRNQPRRGAYLVAGSLSSHNMLYWEYAWQRPKCFRAEGVQVAVRAAPNVGDAAAIIAAMAGRQSPRRGGWLHRLWHSSGRVPSSAVTAVPRPVFRTMWSARHSGHRGLPRPPTRHGHPVSRGLPLARSPCRALARPTHR